jgi:hypothetical protein
MVALNCTATYRVELDGTTHLVTVEQELAVEDGAWTLTVTTPSPHDVRAEFEGSAAVPLQAAAGDLHALLVEAATAAADTDRAAA